jgi:hypothetical protein
MAIQMALRFPRNKRRTRLANAAFSRIFRALAAGRPRERRPESGMGV